MLAIELKRNEEKYIGAYEAMTMQQMKKLEGSVILCNEICELSLNKESTHGSSRDAPLIYFY